MKFSTRIMIVDDEEMICESLQAWFIKDGYQVETALKKLPSPNSCNCVCILTEQDSSCTVFLLCGILQLLKMMEIFAR